MMPWLSLAEAGLLPDAVIRVGIRRLLARRLRRTDQGDDDTQSFVAALRGSPLRLSADAANEQHYEVPAEFFQRVLGPQLKYSCCLFEHGDSGLPEAEESMLQLTCQRAEIEDGMRILELGCGWGALTLWMARHFPQSHIMAVSNSRSQREWIEDRCRAEQISNVRVVTADMQDFSTAEQMDRVVSVEMFEHMRNYELLLSRIAGWLRPSGKLFVHLFCHRERPYLFEQNGSADWMARHFFTGGMMPSQDLLSCFDHDLCIEAQWQVNGEHYWRTCEAWLKNLDTQRPAIQALFQRTGASSRLAARQAQRWRIFFMACAELFRYDQGREWLVAHYRLVRPA